MSYQQQQSPTQGNSRTGFSTLPEGAQQAFTGVLGVAIVAIMIFSFSYFLGTGTGKQILFESTKTVTLALIFFGLMIFGFMWIRVSVSKSPSLIEMAIPIVGLLVWFSAIAIYPKAWAFAVSGSAAVINMTLN